MKTARTMFVPLARASLAALAVVALALPLSAATPPPFFSPVAAGIDKVCSPVARGANAKPTIRLGRLIAADGTLGPWLHSNPDLEERSIDSPAFHGGDFVIVNEATALFVASETHHDATSAQTSPNTAAWCFEGGKLSRATFDLIEADQQLEFRHTQYFDSDLDEPTADEIETVSIDGKHKGNVPQPSPSAMAIERYHTPDDLPFFEAYEAALDHKLPMLPTPAP